MYQKNIVCGKGRTRIPHKQGKEKQWNDTPEDVKEKKACQQRNCFSLLRF